MIRNLNDRVGDVIEALREKVEKQRMIKADGE